MNPAGNFVVTWTDGTTSADTRVFARSFRANGTPASSATLIATGATSPIVDMNPSGQYAIAWRDDTKAWLPSVRAHRYSLSGAPIGPELSQGAAPSVLPAVNWLPDGALVLSLRPAPFSLPEFSSTATAPNQTIVDWGGVAASGSVLAMGDSGRGFLIGKASDNDQVGTVHFVGLPVIWGTVVRASELGLAENPTRSGQAGRPLPPLAVTLRDAAGQVVATDKTKLTLEVLDGPAGGRLAGPRTALPKNGLATFRGLTAQTAGTYTVRISGGTLGPVTTTLTVVPGASVKAVLAPPAGMTHGTPFSAQVELLDRFGNLVTSSDSVVTLALGARPRNTTITGTLSATTVAGIATFDELALQTPGTYALVASAGKVRTTSKKFTVA